MRDTVSLRDLPATIVDLIGLGIRAAIPRPVAGETVARSLRRLRWSRQRHSDLRAGEFRTRLNSA